METSSETVEIRIARPDADGVMTDAINGASAAGDWEVFKGRCAFLDATPVLAIQQNIEAKRQYALDYLGERAQLRGGVFRPTKPTVFTETVVASLARRNTAARNARYPWLAQMMSLIAALDDAQYNMAGKFGNVLAFPESPLNRNVQ